MIAQGKDRGTRVLRRIALAISILSAPAAFAVPALAEPPAPSARLLASSVSGVTFEVDVPAPRIVPVATQGGTFQRVDLDGFAGDGAFGQPVLPAQMIWIAVPEGARVTVVGSG